MDGRVPWLQNTNILSGEAGGGHVCGLSEWQLRQGSQAISKWCRGERSARTFRVWPILSTRYLPRFSKSSNATTGTLFCSISDAGLFTKRVEWRQELSTQSK